MASAPETLQSGATPAGAAPGNGAGDASAREVKMAADIAELRSIVLAAAKHFKVDLPGDRNRPSDPPSPPRATFVLRPEVLRRMGEAYDEDATVRHRIFLAPTESMLAAPQWGSMFGLESPRARVKLTPRSWSLDTAEGGLHTLAEWQLGPLMAQTVREYGYTRGGHLCSMNSTGPGQGVIEDRVMITKRELLPGMPPWAEQRFGKEWVFFLHSKSDPLSLSIAVCQLLDSAFDPNHPSAYPGDALLGSPVWLRAVELFVQLFAGHWPTRGLILHHHRLASCQFPHPPAPDRHIFQFHMRLLEASPFRHRTVPGLQRACGSIRTSRASNWRLFVREKRISAAVRTTFSLDLPVFSIVVLMDFGTTRAASGLRMETLNRQIRLDELQGRSMVDSEPTLRLTGLTAFVLRLHALLQAWASEWNLTLDNFEAELHVQVADILTRSKRRKIMYDSSELRMSEFYFFTSQLLRFSDSWIRESLDDLSELMRGIRTAHFFQPTPEVDRHESFQPDTPLTHGAAFEAFKESSEALLARHQELAGPLLAQIKRIQEEVKRLREGLFTATAVSEATKSKKLNHYIIVFTVVTIFYLPLSFVASLYALDIFDWANTSQKTSFITTIVLVALATYAFSGYLIWIVGKPRRLQMVKEARRAASVGKLFRRMRRGEKKGAQGEAASHSETGSSDSDQSEVEEEVSGSVGSRSQRVSFMSSR
ncbi:hypothetical protein C8A05DRAFT_36623 [Staphylotrichum tortipilum]|uniref:Uncharacterized protein n=1 Tax=Staphylotrichum tortipilum TaxID=2831512 RepID=A0AAN6MFC3_9PEZI|nr:hypothetical protein C8A05DRAFT_36623 [Staphylotrichum longicolle]